jgi:hypothetical protein
MMFLGKIYLKIQSSVNISYSIMGKRIEIKIEYVIGIMKSINNCIIKKS